MSQKRTVLVIDDEESVADALGIILDDSGYRSTIALTGSDGLDKYDRQVFDVVITDLCLPDTSGLEVLTQIRRKGVACVVIVITAHGTPELTARSLGLGANAFLPKPFSPSELLELIARLLPFGAPIG